VNEKHRILLVDDDPIILDSLAEFLRLEGYEVRTADGFQAATEWLAKEPISLVITDVNMSGSNGFELLKVIRQHYPDTVAVMITGYGTIESAVEAIKMGAYDYLTKPIVDDEISLVVQRALQQQALVRENRSLREQLNQRYGLKSVIGQDYKMLKIYDLIESVADTKTTVLMQGDSGTGKSLVARALHQLSSRRDKPFVEVSCGALPETLLESELFGHVRGAFTGAVQDKQGRFQSADGGTIFLDEINSASQAMQVKLLRVLQERQFEPVGAQKTITVDVRVVLASNVDLADLVKQGQFRQDLFYRINVVTIYLPRLGERLSDIPLLARHFLDRYRKEAGKDVAGITEECLRLLQRYAWPGNVRELENVVERAVVLTKNRWLTPDDLPPELMATAQQSIARDEAYGPMSLKEALEGPEREIIAAALRRNDWNRQATADELEINRTTLYKKMKRYDLEFSTAETTQ
jgi:DNA-binding NtrC family response regulator